VPDPPCLPVVPFRKRLFQPFHDTGKFQPILRLDIKRKPIIFKTQATNLEDKPALRFPKHLSENRSGLRPAEQWFPVVDAGADFVPDTLLE
jgi:hypothetical protein